MNSQKSQSFAYASSDAVNHSDVTPGGSVDRIHQERIEGWCVDPLAPHEPVTLELRICGTPVAEFVTEVVRPDIGRCFGTETPCGYSFDFADIPPDRAAAALARHEEELAARPDRPADLRVTVKGKPVELPRWAGLISDCDNKQMLLCLRASQAIDSIGWFDADWYSAENPDIAALGLDPFKHYRERGFREGRPPNGAIKEALGGVGIRPHNPLAGPQSRIVALIADSRLLDAAWYQREYDVPAEEAIVHYVSTGAFLGYDPSPFFSSLDYLKANPEAAKGGFNPLAHLILTGFSERRGDLNPLADLRLTARDWLKGF
jgi:hypothetical protein